MAQGQTRGCLWWIVRIGGGIVLAVLVLIALGMLFEAQGQRGVRAAYPPPGQIVTVNGHDMHIVCEGTGSPTVILDAGQGGWSTGWEPFIDELSQETRVCAYDRSGYGWSAQADDERSPHDVATELELLLAAAEIEPPYLLVGFSHAGLADRIFAAKNTDDMAGLILIDPATEYDNESLTPELLQMQRATQGVFSAFALAARLGIVRLMGPENMTGQAPFIAEAPVNPDLYYSFIADPQWWATSA